MDSNASFAKAPIVFYALQVFTPSRPVDQLGGGAARGAAAYFLQGDFIIYLLVMLFFNIVRRIVELT
jgi:hypothetical protein